jgi:hypothetical protein
MRFREVDDGDSGPEEEISSSHYTANSERYEKHKTVRKRPWRSSAIEL